MPPSISVVFPMYNEEEYVELSVTTARDAIGALTDDFEIIVVDDASTDQTGPIAERLAAADSRVHVVHNATNRTLGGALRAGYAVASKELILYSDGDLPFDLGEVGRAVRLLEVQHADVLAAYRFERTTEGFVRAVYSQSYNLLIRFLFGLRIKDVNFSFKLFRRSLLRKIELKSEGSFIDAEFLLRAHKAGARIIQIGVDYFPRGRGVSKLASRSVILRILAEMWRYRRELS